MRATNRPRHLWILTVAALAAACWTALPAGPASSTAKTSEMVAGMVGAPSEASETLDLIVSYRWRPGEEEKSRIEALQGTIGRQFSSIDALSVKLPAAAVRELAEEPSVAWISLDARVSGTAKGGKNGGGSDGDTCNSFWYEQDFTGLGVTVAVVDSGVLAEHPDLEEEILAAPEAWQIELEKPEGGS